MLMQPQTRKAGSSTQDKTVMSYALPVDVLADADEAVGVLEEHLLQRDDHALKVPRPLLDVVADLQYAYQMKGPH
jgi:hypothetical protein